MTLDDLLEIRVRIGRHETELVGLKRHGELGMAPSPPPNQWTGRDRFLVSICFGERSTLPRFPKLLYTWALSHQNEDALTHSRPIPMTGKKYRSELEREYGRRIVEQSLTVWSALTKAVKKDNIIEGIVVGAKAPSEVW